MARVGILEKKARERNMTVAQLVITTFNQHQSVDEAAAALNTTRATIYGIMNRKKLVIKHEMVQASAS
jgi:DNA invertase Pin-like site-specific DNA recombinase